jgi:rod shape-determining protein MreD
VFRGSGVISYLHPLLAFIIGVAHAALAPVIVIGGVKPNLVLVAVVLVTVLIGFLPGVVWAFVGGLTANLLVGEPLGAVPLAMLIVTVVVAGGARALGRMTWVYPILAVLAGSVVADLASLVLGQLVANAPLLVGLPWELIIGAAILNAVIAAIFLYPARAVAQRYALDEAPAW